MQVQIVVDLGFGDSGKGLYVDYLASVSADPARTLVIRFSGGHQAGHTVHYTGQQHVFSNFGAATMRGVPSFFSEHCVIFPPAIALEYKELQHYQPRLYIHPLAWVTTPWDIAWNRCVETAREHGSCGLGIGATIERSSQGLPLYAQDLRYEWILKQKLASIQAYYQNRPLEPDYGDPYFHKSFASRLASSEQAEKKYLNRKAAWHTELASLEPAPFIEACRDAMRYYECTRLTDLKSRFTNYIFEGSQGILLDQNHGIFPHVTWAHTTSQNAWQIIQQDLEPASKPGIYYVTRCYQTRHGTGPMSDTANIILQNTHFESNQDNPYQGALRYCELDPELLNYALDCDQSRHPAKYCPGKNLLITCLDQRPDFNVQSMLEQLEPNFDQVLGSYGPSATDIQMIRPRVAG